MCVFRSCRTATFRFIMSHVRVGIRLSVGVVYMRSFSEEMLRQYRWRGIKSSIFPILFTICEVCLFVSIVLAYQDKEYKSAIFGVIVMMCSIPFLGRAWGMRD